MAIKPSDLVLWVPGAEPAKMTSPSGAKRAEGWVSGEKPAFQTMNYLQNNWGQWLEYFETVTDDFETRITDNTNDIGTNTSDITTINADVNSYTIVQADVSPTAGTFTLSSGFIKWHISGKKIWVYWRVNGNLTVSDSADISIDVVTNTSLPSNPWPGLQEAVSDNFPPGTARIESTTNGFRILANTGLVLQGSHVWGGSFFFSLP